MRLALPEASFASAVAAGALLPPVAVLLQSPAFADDGPLHALASVLMPVFFFASMALFVGGADIGRLYARTGFLGLPRDRGYWPLMLRVWGRMLAWFAGGVVSGLSLNALFAR